MINMMKKIMIITMPLILAVSVIMVLNSANVNVFGQANQTSTQNNQTSSGGNQTSATSNQTSSGGNQTSNDQLLNYTNEAIKAQKGGHKTDLTDNLKKLQEALIKSSGKQVVIVPDTSSSGKSSGSSSSGSSSSDKSSGSSSSDKSSGSSSSNKSKSK
jgi:hypothetical protein